MELNDRQLDQHKCKKITYDESMDMEEKEVEEFITDLSCFLEEKLGKRLYACAISFETHPGAPRMILHTHVIGLERPSQFLKMAECVKGLYHRLAQISNQISSPLVEITPENNPVVQRK